MSRYQKGKSSKRCMVCGGPTSTMGSTRNYRATCSPRCLAEARGETYPIGVLTAKEVSLRCRRKLKIEVLIRYGGNPPRCNCCGEHLIEFLTIDHIGGGGAEHRRQLGNGSLGNGGSKLYRWLRKNEYPDGYRVLCQNCNFSHGVFGYCPHKSPSVHLSDLYRARGMIDDVEIETGFQI